MHTYTDAIGLVVILWILVVWSLPQTPMRTYFMGMTFFGLGAYLLATIATVRARDGYQHSGTALPLPQESQDKMSAIADYIIQRARETAPRGYRSNPMYLQEDQRPDLSKKIQERTAIMQLAAANIPEPLDVREEIKRDAAHWMNHDRDWVRARRS